MNPVMGVIYLNSPQGDLSLLTQQRCLGAIPFGAKYRLIDFCLTGMTRASITNIGILSTWKYRPLINHIGKGKEWCLDRKRDGLFWFFPGFTDRSVSQNPPCTDLQIMRRNLDYFMNSNQQLIVLAPGNLVGQLDLTSAIRSHVHSEADATILYTNPIPHVQFAPIRTLGFSTDHRVNRFETIDYYTEKDPLSLDVFILKKELMIDLIIASASEPKIASIPELFNHYLHKLTINGCYQTGPITKISSLEEYFLSSLKLLHLIGYDNKHGDLINPPPITKSRDLIPTKYGNESQVSNALIADGCEIHGKVKDSIIFHSVTVEPEAEVQKSIVFPQSTIKSGSSLKHIIADKYVTISRNMNLGHSKERPMIITKNSSLI